MALVVTTVAAGCSDPGDGGGGTPAPPNVTDVSLSGPETATVGEDLTLTLSARNDGGQEGTYEDTVTVVEGNSEFEESVSLTVPAGETAETEVGPVTLETGGEYAFELSSGADSLAVTAEPQSAAVGGRLRVSENVRATLSAADYRQAVFYRYGGGLSGAQTGVLSAASGRTLALFRLEFENVGTDPASVDPETFELDAGSFYDGLPNGAGLDRADLDGDPVAGLTLQASQTRQGWLLAQVPREAASDGLELSVQRDARQTPPEGVWSISAADGFPTFELVSVDAPSTAQSGTGYEIAVEVRNAGDAAGTFRGVLQFESDGGGWGQLGTADPFRLAAEIPAGETERLVSTNSPSVTGSFTYRLQPFTREWETTLQG
jgi:hypothetical protein